MRKKMGIIIVCTGFFAVTSLTSGYIGYRMNGHTPKVMSQIIEGNKSSNLVAVVNLDEGVQQDGETVNYSTSLFDWRSEKFVSTSLGEAQEGLDNGTYMAYVIIPATFSQKAVSLNSDPQKSVIQYKISDSVDEDTKEDAMYQIFNLEKELNDNLGYMYISAILEEFRGAQDDAQTILENDKEDLATLLSINDYDLVSLVDIGDLKTYDEELKQEDLTAELENIDAYIKSIEDKYKTYLANGETDLTTIQTDSTSLTEDTSVLDVLKKMGNFKDENGTAVYSNGKNKIKSTLTGYNAALSSEKEQVKTTTTQTIEDLEAEANKQLKAILGISEGGVSPSINTINGNFANFKNIMKGEVLGNVQQTITNLNISDATSVFSADAITDYKTKVNDNVTAGIANSDISSTITDYTAMKNEMAFFGRIISYLNTNTIDELLAQTTAEPNHELNQLALSVSGMDFAQYAASGNIDNTGDRYQEANLKGQISALVSSYILQDDDQMSQALRDNLNVSGQATILAAVNQATTDSLSGLYTNRIESLDSTYDEYSLSSENAEITFDNEDSIALKQTLEDNVNAIGSVDTDQISTMVQDKVIAPMKTITTTENTNAAATVETKNQKMSSLDALIAQYNPLTYIKNDELAKVYSDIDSNNSKIGEKIADNSTNSLEYATKTNEAATENLSNIIEKIQKGNEEANKKIADSLESAKNSRTQLNRLNKNLLTKFIEKLGYTRLGKGAFSKAYKFIVNPVDFSEESSGE